MLPTADDALPGVRLLETILSELVCERDVSQGEEWPVRIGLTVEERLLYLLPARHDKGSVLYHLLLEGLTSNLGCIQVSWNTSANSV